MMNRLPLARIVSAVAAFALLGCPPSTETPVDDSAPSSLLADCTVPGVDRPVQCGTIEVFENRAAGSGRTIPLHVVVLPAMADNPEPDPILFFAGGPGGSAVEAAPWLAFDWAETLERRDLVLVDVRGTGESNPLICPYQEKAYGVAVALETFIPVDELPACREALEAKADLTQYTTANIVDDVDEVVRTLGYDQVNLVGGSYGTRVVQSYLRRHGDSVRTAILEGAVPMDAFMPSTFARDMQAAFDGIVAECLGDPACSEAFPDPRGDLDSALATLRAEPVSIEVVDPKTQQDETLVLSDAALLQTVRYLLYDAIGALQVPAFVHAAANGNWQPIGQAAWSIAGGLMAGLPDGLYLSVVCAEDVVHIDTELATEQAEGTLLGDFRLRQQVAACEGWPVADVPESFHDPVVSAVPAFLISGERDPVTPAAWGDQVGAAFENSIHMVVPDGAHGYFGLDGIECVNELVQQVFETGSIVGLDTETCANSIERPPFLLETSAGEPIELTTAELERCAGSYGEKGLVGEVAVGEDGTLRVTTGKETNVLTPISPARFIARGAPPGDYFEFIFDADDGSPASGVRMVRAGVVMLELPRQQ